MGDNSKHNSENHYQWTMGERTTSTGSGRHRRVSPAPGLGSSVAYSPCPRSDPDTESHVLAIPLSAIQTDIKGFNFLIICLNNCYIIVLWWLHDTFGVFPWLLTINICVSMFTYAAWWLECSLHVLILFAFPKRERAGPPHPPPTFHLHLFFSYSA